MRSTLPPDTHNPTHKLTNVRICVFWVRVDLARIGMIAEFSTLREFPLSLSPHQMRPESEGEGIYLWRIELARLRESLSTNW